MSGDIATTAISPSDAPPGLRAALGHLQWLRPTIVIRAREQVVPSTDSQAYTCASVVLSDDECAVLYAHRALKSGPGRRAVVQAHAAGLESLVTRGLVKRAANGACQITTAGVALRDQWDRRGQALAYKVRW